RDGARTASCAEQPGRRSDSAGRAAGALWPARRAAERPRAGRHGSGRRPGAEPVRADRAVARRGARSSGHAGAGRAVPPAAAADAGHGGRGRPAARAEREPAMIMAEPSFSLSLSLAVPAAELSAWFAAAEPGHRAVYASGLMLP